MKIKILILILFTAFSCKDEKEQNSSIYVYNLEYKFDLDESQVTQLLKANNVNYNYEDSHGCIDREILLYNAFPKDSIDYNFNLYFFKGKLNGIKFYFYPKGKNDIYFESFIKREVIEKLKISTFDSSLFVVDKNYVINTDQKYYYLSVMNKAIIECK